MSLPWLAKGRVAPTAAPAAPISGAQAARSSGLPLASPRPPRPARMSRLQPLLSITLVLAVSCCWTASVRAKCDQNDAKGNWPTNALWPGYGRYTNLDSDSTAGATKNCARGVGWGKGAGTAPAAAPSLRRCSSATHSCWLLPRVPSRSQAATRCACQQWRLGVSCRRRNRMPLLPPHRHQRRRRRRRRPRGC